MTNEKIKELNDALNIIKNACAAEEEDNQKLCKLCPLQDFCSDELNFSILKDFKFLKTKKIKKRIGDFTFFEADEICRKAENCETCPFFSGNPKNGLKCLTVQRWKYDKKIEIEE